jgi:hypothetical protein
VEDTKQKNAKQINEPFPPFHDAFTSTIRPVWREGKVTVHNVFACRVLLDILSIYKDSFKVLEDFKKEGGRASKLFQFKTGPGGVLDVGGGTRWTSRDTELLMSI